MGKEGDDREEKRRTSEIRDVRFRQLQLSLSLFSIPFFLRRLRSDHKMDVSKLKVQGQF